MQTRRQQERTRASAQSVSQEGTPVGMNQSNTGGVTDQDTETPIAAEPQKTRRQSNEVFNAVIIPAKRKKATPSPPPAPKKLAIPHSAKLPRIVWVFDTKYQWWPGEITQYPPVNHRATVSRFGNIRPKMSYSEAFETALKQANEAQIEDDDDLPGWDDVMNELSTTPVPAAPAPASSTLKESQRKLAKTESIYLPDTSLAIPGELVLAWSDRFYYPGRVSSFNSKTNKYKARAKAWIDFATGHSSSVERKKFFTRYEKGFQTCSLGTLAMPSAIDNYQDKELESQIHELYPDLYAIVSGKHDEANRLKAFLEGGKAKRTLAQRVGPGSFGRGEYGLINALLQSEFLPDLVTTKKRNSGTTVATPMKREGDVTRDFSNQMRLHFVTDVLLPETITRLTMRRNNINYAEADRQIIECKRDEDTDTWWVDDILAARESFLDGKAS
ncbi:hypothetical protein BGX27_001276 [Mortierella sp. AM989]|nr:hypothetical protein BGX27_001276 [Mortierella sp. AM989]